MIAITNYFGLFVFVVLPSFAISPGLLIYEFGGRCLDTQEERIKREA